MSFEGAIFRSATEGEGKVKEKEKVCTGRESIEALGHVYRRRRLVYSLPVSRKSSLGLFPRR